MGDEAPGVDERNATVLPFTEVADWLQIQLGQQLTAYVAGLRDAKVVGRWRSGRAQPRAAAELRLRFAYDAVRLVADAYDARTARAWLLGSNSRLDDESPVWLIREAETSDDLRLVVAAASAFAGSGA